MQWQQKANSYSYKIWGMWTMFLVTYIVDLPFGTTTNFYPIHWIWIEQVGVIVEKAGVECANNMPKTSSTNFCLCWKTPWRSNPFQYHILKYAYVFWNEWFLLLKLHALQSCASWAFWPTSLEDCPMSLRNLCESIIMIDLHCSFSDVGRLPRTHILVLISVGDITVYNISILSLVHHMILSKCHWGIPL